MAESGPLADKWTSRFLDYLGSACLLTAVDVAVKDEAYIVALVLLAIGAAILAIGIKWETVKPRIYQPFYVSLCRVASDARWWIGLLIVFIVTARVPAIIRAARSAIRPLAVSTGSATNATPRAVNRESVPSEKFSATASSAAQPPKQHELSGQKMLILASMFRAASDRMDALHAESLVRNDALHYVPNPSFHFLPNCQVSVSSAPSNMEFRNTVITVARNMGCDAWALSSSPNPLDADATPTPEAPPLPYVVVRFPSLNNIPTPSPGSPLLAEGYKQFSERAANEQNREADEFVAGFRAIGVDAKRSHKLGSPPNPYTVYIDLGSASPWS